MAAGPARSRRTSGRYPLPAIPRIGTSLSDLVVALMPCASVAVGAMLFGERPAARGGGCGHGVRGGRRIRGTRRGRGGRGRGDTDGPGPLLVGACDHGLRGLRRPVPATAAGTATARRASRPARRRHLTGAPRVCGRGWRGARNEATPFFDGGVRGCAALSPGTWLLDGRPFGNVGTLVRSYGLPGDVDAMAAYMAGTPSPRRTR
ncbi:hypothetical protein ACFYYY_21685 [Streptomyces sp. NPDC001834]|uniref:hypothetical protein n=1 Tax=Streptomyces sp. NPDC001834 TaxID=3364616 RepID=UPI0036AA260D